MFKVIPEYCLRAYALFYLRHGSRESFRQNELDWIVGQSMKKKIFSVLLNSGWIKKESRTNYKCSNPETVIKKILEFRVPEIMKAATKPYAFTNLSAVEIWSDFSYVQRSIERSPYFIKVLRKDLRHWTGLFNKYNIPNYINQGSTIGEFVILIPVKRLTFEKKDSFNVDTLKNTIKIAQKNEMYLYPLTYIKRKYGTTAN